MVCVQVLEAVLERLQDFEDKVRSRSITAICEAAMASPEVRPSTNFRTCGTDIALLLLFCSSAQSCSIVLCTLCTKHRQHAR